MSARIGTDLNYATQLLRSQELVAIPTETVYGLAGNAFDEVAIKKIFITKGRPFFNPLIVHTGSIEQMETFVESIPAKAKKLLENLSPGPVTLILKKKSQISDLVTAGKDSIAVRIPAHPLTLQLLKQLDFPLAAPSANPFGYISPVSVQHVSEQLGEKIPYILDGGQCRVGIESTIIRFDIEQPTILRPGGVSVESIEALIGAVATSFHKTEEQAPVAPGQLKSHYAPKRPLIICNPEEHLISNNLNNARTGVITFFKKIDRIPKAHQVQLSPDGDLNEAAANLFAAMHYLDGTDIDLILAEAFPDEGLGMAINDRLLRASAKVL